MQLLAVAVIASWSAAAGGMVGFAAGSIMAYRLAREDNAETELEVQHWKDRASQERALGTRGMFLNGK